MNDDELTKHITSQLDAGMERLDGATRSQLTQARHRALTARHHRPLWIWPAAGSALLASIVAVTIWMGRASDAGDPFSVNDFEMLTNSDDIELYQDLEFMQWLDEAESNGVV